MSDLIKIDEAIHPEKLFSRPTIEEILKQAREKTHGFYADVSTSNGRADTRSMATKVAKSRSVIKKAKEDYVRRLKLRPAEVIAEWKHLDGGLLDIQTDVRKDLTDYENIRKRVDETIGGINATIRECDSLPSGIIQEKITWLDSLIAGEIVEDKRDEFTVALDNAKDLVGKAYARAKKAEEDAAELERLRIEKAENDRKNREREIAEAAAARAKKEAEDAAEAKIFKAKLEKGKAERDKKAAEDKAEQEKRAAEARAEEEKKAAVEDALARAKEYSPEVVRSQPSSQKRETITGKTERKVAIEKAESSLRILGYSAQESERLVQLISDGKVKCITLNVQ
jgi:hypothetical protein